MNDHKSDDTEIIRQRAQAGDRSAVAVLFEIQASALRRWAHRRLPVWARSVSDTADLVQDAIVRTLGQLDRIDVSERGALQAYLRQAVSNQVKDEFRRIHRRGLAEPLDDIHESAVPSPFQDAVARDLEQRYKGALSRLRERDRILIVGHVELDYTLDQLACLCGRSAGTTRTALRRALLRLAQLMDPTHE